MPELSVLDLVRIRQDDASPRDALERAADLAQYAEQLGFRRYWVAEHHNMRGIGSAATSIVIAHIAEATSTIRIGSGGIMLPNHSPLLIAEQFGTLAALYGDRIDLGLGRAPGTDGYASRALRRDPQAADRFPQDVLELQALLGDPVPDQAVIATPGAGTHVPIWILGSSLFGARLAAELGLPFGFASHFAPQGLDAALNVYRTYFKPSEQLAAPYALIGVIVVAADTDAEAKRLATTAQMASTNILRDARTLSLPPIDNIDDYWTPQEKPHVLERMTCSAIGSPETVRERLAAIAERTQADEFMIVSDIYDHEARKHSLDLTVAATENYVTPSEVEGREKILAL
jgi:luciferase family oxidoreductase group 1